MKDIYVIGLMSGTSLDGVDLVYVKFDELNSFQIIKSITIPYPAIWIKSLKNVASISKGDHRLIKLDLELGDYFSCLILGFIRLNNISIINCIASHGHTVHHQPQKGYTLQIGCGFEIYKKTQIKTIFDFRTQDVELGGQGAPLVPVGDELLFPQYDYCLNLGGFSNVSFKYGGQRKAFDICPVNIVLNYYVGQLGFLYDDKGSLSKKGTVCVELLDELNQLSFYKSTKPKSLGIEFVVEEIYPLIANYSLAVKDILRTFVEHIAIQIVRKIIKGSLLITGGGAYHLFLIERIKSLNPLLNIIIPKKEVIEYKEALIFAFLAKLRLENKVNCLSSVTGASVNHSSGVIVG